jgi:hypothetical protein
MKKGLLVVLLLVLISSVIAITASAKGPGKFDTFTSAFKNHDLAPDPDGKQVKVTDKRSKDNRDKAPNLKKAENLDGYVSDEDLSKVGGKYAVKKMMTYREYFDQYGDGGYNHTIDPNRMVWVLVSKFDKTHYVDGSPVEKAIVTSLYDAETGELLEMGVTSEDPNGMVEFFKNRKRE